jgi:hypothetical protein
MLNTIGKTHLIKSAGLVTGSLVLLVGMALVLIRNQVIAAQVIGRRRPRPRPLAGWRFQDARKANSI